MFLIYDYLNNHTTSLKSAILEAITPTEFMHDYQKKAVLLESFDDEIIQNFNRNGEWLLSKSDYKYLSKLKRFEKSNLIKLITTIKPRVNPKVVIGYEYNHNHNYQRINNYLHIVEQFFYQNTILRSDLLEITTASVLNTLEKNEVIYRVDVTIKREVTHKFDLNDKDILLNNDQKKAYNEIVSGFNTNKEYLLYGVTGSGKTEVYLKVIEEVIKMVRPL